MALKKFILPVLIFLILSYSGYKEYFKNGLYELKTHQTMAELGLLNLPNSGVVWYGVYSYFNDEPVVDLLYKTRDCKNISPRGEFYPGHNKYDYLKDTGLSYYVGKLWKPSQEELGILTGYKVVNYKGVYIFRR